jgi:signal transduction histidine kinase
MTWDARDERNAPIWSVATQIVALELVVVGAWALTWHGMAGFRRPLPWVITLGLLLPLATVLLVRQHAHSLRRAARAARAFADGRGELVDPHTAHTDEDVHELQRSLSAASHAVTEREQILRSHVLQLQEVETLKKEFVSTVSHELRTPLTAMRGALGLVLAGAAGDVAPRARELLEIARQNTERLIRLINDILDVERLEGGHLEVHREPCDLRAVLETTLEGMRTVATEADVRLEITGASPAIVSGDGDRLVQVFTNLLSNAVRYSPRGTTVTVSLETTGSVARVAVRDRGPGIPVAFHPRIFGKFQQAEPHDTSGGTGLGLAIARAIVDRHSGTIGFTTVEGEGTTFTVELPYTPPVPSLGAARNGRYRILVLDRDPHIVSLFRTLCEPFSDVIGAGSADVAWTVLTGPGSVDALVVDPEAAGSDDIALVRRARGTTQYAGLPVLVFSAREFTAAELEGVILAPSHAFVKARDRERDVLRRLQAVLAVRRPR